MRPTSFGRMRTRKDESNRKARQWLEIVLGLLLGLALGISIAWTIAPNARLDPSPAALRADFKDEYRLLVASAYTATGDLGRAQSRLSLLGDADPVQALLDQSRRAYASGASQQTVSALSLLAETIQQADMASPSPAETSTSTPLAPTATLAPFVLVSQETVCDPTLPAGLTRIQVRDGTGQPLAGVEIRVTWDSGFQQFYTGLKPEMGNGYADFVMAPGIAYSLQIFPSGSSLNGLSAPECTTAENSIYWGSYLLTFEQP
jgi:hypothetical protein